MQLIAAVYDEKGTQAIKMAVRAGGAALAERSSLDPFWSFLRALFLNLAISMPKCNTLRGSIGL